MDIVVKRIIDAPVALVWKAWTDLEFVKRWWGPANYTSPSCKIDLRVGGTYIFCMRAPAEQGGQDSYTAGTYSRIVDLQCLEFTQRITDQDGNAINPVQIGLPPDFPEIIHMRVEFKKIKGGEMTELTATESGWTASQMYVFSIAGLHQTIDKLIESLASA